MMKTSPTRSKPLTNTAAGAKPPRRIIRSLTMMAALLLVPVTQTLASSDVVASYYGQRFHGRTTASGKPFNMYAMTAAHKRLRFGTRVRVTNKASGRSVVVTINDRGPYIRGRTIDLSYGAAKKIGILHSGTARVRIETLGRGGSGASGVGSRTEVARELVLMDLF